MTLDRYDPTCMRGDLDRLEDILGAIAKAEKYKDGGEERFLQDELLQVWSLHHLQIIGEAARGLTPEFRKRTAHVPWPQIIGLRNILDTNTSE